MLKDILVFLPSLLSRGERRDAAVNFDTYRDSCGFFTTARLSCIHQWPFKCWNYTQYTEFQRPRPRLRPIKQQQEYITEKNSSVATRVFVIKNNLVQKHKKVMTSNVWHCWLLLHLHERTQVLVTFQHYHVTQRLVAHNSVGNKTKSMRPRPRLRPVFVIRPRLIFSICAQF